MPHYSTTIELAGAVADVFAFFAQPALLVGLAPPELRLELVEGPERLQPGSRLRWKARRWGVSQHLVSAVTVFEENARIVEEQLQGPFARWVVERLFEPSGAGTRLREGIDFEPPGGMLGRMVTADAVRADLERLAAFRDGKLKALFGS